MSEGGFPLSTNTFDFLQQSYTTAISALTALAGDKAILRGCKRVGTIMQEGYIIYEGEVLPFRESTYDIQVSVYEETQQVVYNEDEDGNGELDQKDGYVTRFAKCGVLGTPVLTFDLSELKRYTPATELLMPKGMITMWSGIEIPEGWALCDGTSGTPDLRGRFVFGADSDNGYNMHDKDGVPEVTLDETQMPSHVHDSFLDDTSGVGAYNVPKLDLFVGPMNSSSTHSDRSHQVRSMQRKNAYVRMHPKGGGLPHTNMPPYYVLAYIMYVGV